MAVRRGLLPHGYSELRASCSFKPRRAILYVFASRASADIPATNRRQTQAQCAAVNGIQSAAWVLQYIGLS